LIASDQPNVTNGRLVAKRPTSYFGTLHYPVLPAAALRSFPPPCCVEQQDACFVVRDHKGQQVAYVNFEDEPGPAI